MSNLRSARVVIGAGFGDEGKGLITDYYTQRMAYEKYLVIRYNGGAQAGHTVVTPDGRRHVFGHFSSGTYNGATTFLPQDFIVNPLLFKKEYDTFEKHGITPPRVFVDPRAKVTTHYDMLMNMAIEDTRGRERHGSCGVGIFETICRSRNPRYNIEVADLPHTDHLRRRLENILIDWIPYRLRDFGYHRALDSRRDLINSKENVEQWLEAVQFFNEHTFPITPEALIEDWSIVFEGAQGLGLDKDSGYHPHTTPSNTGLPNVVRLAHEMGINKLNVTYVTRCYSTRHGAGPLHNEYKTKFYKKIEDSTNQPNPYQGNFRIGHLNLDSLNALIRRDTVNERGLSCDFDIAVTCLDQISEDERAVWVPSFGIGRGSKKELLGSITNHTAMKIGLVSHGPTRNDVIPFRDYKGT